MVRTADLAPTRPLEVALLRAALRWNPNNDVAKNWLGQLLYWEGEFEEAKSLLESVVDRDNHALACGMDGHFSDSRESRSAITRARGEIAAALQTWAFGEGNPEERKKWLNQVGNLAAEGEEFDQCVAELLDYANDNSRWDTVNLESVAQARRIGGSRPSESESAYASCGTSAAPQRGSRSGRLGCPNAGSHGRLSARSVPSRAPDLVQF